MLHEINELATDAPAYTSISHEERLCARLIDWSLAVFAGFSLGLSLRTDVRPVVQRVSGQADATEAQLRTLIAQLDDGVNRATETAFSAPAEDDLGELVDRFEALRSAFAEAEAASR